MIEAHAHLKYRSDSAGTRGMDCWALFLPIVGGDGEYVRYLSEDWAYCQRWRNLGGEIWADTSLIWEHQGKARYRLWGDDSGKEPRREVDLPGLVRDMVAQHNLRVFETGGAE